MVQPAGIKKDNTNHIKGSFDVTNMYRNIYSFINTYKYFDLVKTKSMNAHKLLLNKWGTSREWLTTTFFFILT